MGAGVVATGATTVAEKVIVGCVGCGVGVLGCAWLDVWTEAIMTGVETTTGGDVTTGGDITTGGGVTTLDAGAITTGGLQNYNENVTLAADETLTSLSSGAVTFAGTVNGAHALMVNTAGATTFGGAVGNSTALISPATPAAESRCPTLVFTDPSAQYCRSSVCDP